MVDAFSKMVSHELEENPEISIRRDHIPRRRYVDRGNCQNRTFVIVVKGGEFLELCQKGENVGKNCH